MTFAILFAAALSLPPSTGVGGIFTGSDVRAKLASGADLVQLYTGFIHKGPLMARHLAFELLNYPMVESATGGSS